MSWTNEPFGCSFNVSCQGVAPVQVRYADGERERLGTDFYYHISAIALFECIYHAFLAIC